MAQTLGQTPVGTIVKIPENGTPTDFIVVQQGNPNPSIYSTTFNNGTWLCRREIVDPAQLLSDNNAQWYKGVVPTSYQNRFTSEWTDKIITVKQPYYDDLSVFTITPKILEDGRSTKFFINTPREIGCTPPSTENNINNQDGSLLTYFSILANSVAPNSVTNPRGGTTSNYWLRGYGASYPGSYRMWMRNTNTSGQTIDGYNNTNVVAASYRPNFVMYNDMTVLDDGTVSLGAVPVSSNSISISLIFMQGQPMNMTWQASPNADSYIVQRNSSADADWVQVQSGSGLSFSETVGSTWTTVQYRIAAVRDGNNSPWTETQVYNVVSTSSLLISGEDGSLGTIDSDVHYSVTSDTGNQITLTRLVNNVQVYTGQVSSGFTYDIPIVELPTGEGTIVINASVQTAGGLVSQSRTWTYTKTAMTFSTVGGISELDQNNQAVWPKTVMEAIRTYGFMGGTLDKTLMTLANAVIRDPDTGAFVDFEGQGIDAPQILVGSYVGTGGNTVTINTPFEPIAILLWVPAELKSGQLNIFGATPILGIKPKPNMQGGGGSQYGSAVANPYAITIPITFGDLFITMTNAEISLPSRNFGYVIFGGQVTS